MKIAIIGFGVEGHAAYDYWRTEADITICDQQTDLALPDDVESQLGDRYLQNLNGFDLIIRSPFVRPDAITSVNGMAIAHKITTVTNEFMQVCPSQNIIGITGTKGKGTTSSLVTAMLRAAGKRVQLGGNIGVAALDLLKNNIQPDDYVVLELSSFQLIDLQQSPHIAACLMMAIEHQDWHLDPQEYFDAKAQLFIHQTNNDIAVSYQNDEQSKAIAAHSNGEQQHYFALPWARVEDDRIVVDDQVICGIHELKLLGQHNWQNACAALTIVWNITQDVPALRKALQEFSGLEHRLELVETIGDVRYYDDSFGTTPETAIVAIEAFDAPKIVILGGSDKGANYDQLAQTVAANNVKNALLIGQQAERIHAALDKAGYATAVDGGNTMPEIVARATELSSPGDVVLLSTGCASFGMFKNYKDRGDQFKQAVRALVSAD